MRYINVRTTGPDEFQVWLGRDGTETVVMVDRVSGKIDFNRRAVGLRVKETNYEFFEAYPLGYMQGRGAS